MAILIGKEYTYHRSIDNSFQNRSLDLFLNLPFCLLFILAQLGLKKKGGRMERGIVKLYDKAGSGGTIGRNGDTDVRFYSDRIIGKDRHALKAGDYVWFEMENIQSQHMAINIRKCI
jgi:cold shock CspA family protein